MKEIPIVDLAKVHGDFITGNESISGNPDWVEASEKIRDGLGGIGFLYLTNHGVSEETISKVLAESKKFFDLPLDTKMKFKKDTSDAPTGTFDVRKFCGYMPIAGETLHASVKCELKETYDWLSPTYSMPTTIETSNLHASIIQLKQEAKQLHKKMLKLFALSLHLDENYFLGSFRHIDDPENNIALESLRLLHYPPIPEEEEIKPGTVRCGEHSDYVFMTMFFQDDVGGLEVQTTDGEWVEAKPIPGAVLVNTGNILLNTGRLEYTQRPSIAYGFLIFETRGGGSTGILLEHSAGLIAKQ